MSNLFSKSANRGIAPRLRLLFEHIGTQAILSIPQKTVNVKFIFRNFTKKVDFSVLSFTVVLSIR